MNKKAIIVLDGNWLYGILKRLLGYRVYIYLNHEDVDKNLYGVKAMHNYEGVRENSGVFY